MTLVVEYTDRQLILDNIRHSESFSDSHKGVFTISLGVGRVSKKDQTNISKWLESIGAQYHWYNYK
jgi:hypothetical protein